MKSKSPFQSVLHQADLCVVGGGLSGMCAALAAARRGIRVVLMHDRPVLGGNASSEVRTWIWGARGKNHRETGLIEEILLDNLYYNPRRNYSIWDAVLFGKVAFQPHLTPLLNCSCNDLEMSGSRIRSITGWQTTTQTWHTVEAKLFADCSGDSVLAPLCGAAYRVGREARGEFEESIAPPEGDRRTMGMSCLIQSRETDSPQEYTPFPWAEQFLTDDDLPERDHDLRTRSWMWNNFWWIELGGDRDAIHDTERVRDELIRAAFGVWDHVKNRGDHGAENWALDWVGFLPGKRENRRYEGDVIVNENDVRSQGRFEDIVAYAGWPMDDHHPGGLRHQGPPSRLYPVKPWGLPYRALYSRNVKNLFFAGRNISVTHAALSSSRVMATCALLGQAVGTAAVLAHEHRLSPRGVHKEAIRTLQEALMEDDCWLPGLRRPIPPLTRSALLSASHNQGEPLRDGVDRAQDDGDHAWCGPIGSWLEYRFEAVQDVSQLRFVFDSHLNRQGTTMLSRYPLNVELATVPRTMLRAFRIEAEDQDGHWTTVHHETNNHQRLVRVPLQIAARALRFIPETTWGDDQARVFAWDVR